MGEKRTKFNLLDALIVLAVIALIAGIIWRQELTERIRIEESEKTVVVSCGFEPVDVRTDVEFAEGETVVYYSDGGEAGVVLVTLSEEDSLGEESGAETERGETAVLRLSAVEKDSGYYLANGEKLTVGLRLKLHSDMYEFTALIDSVGG